MVARSLNWIEFSLRCLNTRGMGCPLLCWDFARCAHLIWESQACPCDSCHPNDYTGIASPQTYYTSHPPFAMPCHSFYRFNQIYCFMENDLCKYNSLQITCAFCSTFFVHIHLNLGEPPFPSYLYRVQCSPSAITLMLRWQVAEAPSHSCWT